MSNVNFDNFKTYEGYEGEYIIEDYARYKNVDTVMYASKEEMDCIEYMDREDLWDTCTIYYIDRNGRAIYATFL